MLYNYIRVVINYSYDNYDTNHNTFWTDLEAGEGIVTLTIIHFGQIWKQEKAL